MVSGVEWSGVEWSGAERGVAKSSRKMFGSKAECSACGQTIAATELVQRPGGPSFSSSPVNARLPYVFHVGCFMCCKCNNKLAPGDRYCLTNTGNLVCEKDWPLLQFKGSPMVSGQQTTTGTTVRKGKVGRPRRSRD
ncbi:hypothetical protein V9T40_000471 [Parthenolecanium corni]|uniref:LIM zinc-binding domain-containing protein n=1 Tax=Parthenolecanium corni TaxID=536013 RepID=A0AAN9T9L0_9HEMI